MRTRKLLIGVAAASLALLLAFAIASCGGNQAASPTPARQGVSPTAASFPLAVSSPVELASPGVVAGETPTDALATAASTAPAGQTPVVPVTEPSAVPTDVVSPPESPTAEDVQVEPTAEPQSDEEPTPIDGEAPAEMLRPANQVSLSGGQKVYADKCVPCHGQSGAGDGPEVAKQGLAMVDLSPAGAEDTRTLTPAWYYLKATQGSDAMPSFESTLSEDERWNAAFYAWSLGSTPENRASGKAQFADKCAPCHGAGGKGDGPQAASLDPKPKDLTSLEYLATITPEELFDVISFGIGEMPGHEDKLTDEQRWEIADYVYNFAYSGPTP